NSEGARSETKRSSLKDSREVYEEEEAEEAAESKTEVAEEEEEGEETDSTGTGTKMPESPQHEPSTMGSMIEEDQTGTKEDEKVPEKESEAEEPDGGRKDSLDISQEESKLDDRLRKVSISGRPLEAIDEASFEGSTPDLRKSSREVVQ